MRKLELAAILLLLTVGLAACESAQQRAEKHLQSALALLQSGDLARARVEFLNVFKLDPTNQKAHLALAKALRDSNDIPGAWQQYLAVAEQDPNDATATLALAQIALKSQNWDQAERYGRRLVKMDVDPDARAAILAVLDYRKAVLDKDAAARRKQAGVIEELVGRGVKTEPMLVALTDWYTFQNEPRKALAEVDELLKLEPKSMLLIQTRLSLLTQLGQTADVASGLVDAIKQFPDNTALVRTLISWYVQHDQLDEAQKFLENRADTTTGDLKQQSQVFLIDFLKQYRNPAVAQVEVEKILKTTDNPDFFRSIHAGLLFAMGQKESAMAELEAVLKQAKPSDQTRRIKVVLADMQRRTGNLVGARALVEQVLAEDPTQVDALKMKASFLIDGDKADQAIVLLRQAQQQSPQDPSLATLLAAAYERNGDRGLMGEMLALAVQYSHQAPAESLRQARFLIGNKDYLAAEDTLTAALRRAPDNLELLAMLASDYILAEKYGDASNVETRLRSIGSKQAIAAADSVKIQLLRKENRAQDLAQMLKSLSSNTSDKVRAALLDVQASITKGDAAGAEKIVDDALATEPGNLNLLYAKAVLAAGRNDMETSRKLLRQIVTSEPKAVPAWQTLSRGYASSGDDKQALAVIDEALAAVPGNATLLYDKAILLERTGDIAGAIKIYQGLYDANTSSIVMANNLASLMSSYSDDPATTEKAYAIARRLRGLPQPAFQDTYGWIAFKRGDVEEALHSLEPAAKGLTSDPLVQYHLGRVYEELKRYGDAATQYKKAIDLLGKSTNKGAADVAERLASVTAEAQKAATTQQ